MKEKHRINTVVVAKKNHKLLAIYYSNDTDESVNECINENNEYYGITHRHHTGGKQLIQCSPRLYEELKNNAGKYSFYEDYEHDWSHKDGIPITHIAQKTSNGIWCLMSELEEERQGNILDGLNYRFPTEEQFMSLSQENKDKLTYRILLDFYRGTK